MLELSSAVLDALKDFSVAQLARFFRLVLLAPIIKCEDLAVFLDLFSVLSQSVWLWNFTSFGIAGFCLLAEVLDRDGIVRLLAEFVTAALGDAADVPSLVG